MPESREWAKLAGGRPPSGKGPGPTRVGSSKNADSNSPRRLPPGKSVFAGDSGVGRDTGAFLGARRQTSQFVIFHLPHPIRLAVVCSAPDPVPLQSPGLHQAHGEYQDLSRLAILFIFGLCGLLLYYVGLSSAHPIITATIFNLSPFWAALVAMVFCGKPSGLALRLLRMFCRGVCRRHDRRLQSVGQHQRTIGERNH